MGGIKISIKCLTVAHDGIFMFFEQSRWPTKQCKGSNIPNITSIVRPTLQLFSISDYIFSNRIFIYICVGFYRLKAVKLVTFQIYLQYAWHCGIPGLQLCKVNHLTVLTICTFMCFLNLPRMKKQKKWGLIWDWNGNFILKLNKYNIQ